MSGPEQNIDSINPQHLSMQAVGRILSDAREKASLSIEDASTHLCIRPGLIDALESGDMDALPGQTFVRGFIRNYSKLLQIDAEPLVEACSHHDPSLAHGAISLRSENIPIVDPVRRGWLTYVKASLVIGVALGIWMVYMDYFAGQPTGSSVRVISAKPDRTMEAEVVSQPNAMIGAPMVSEMPSPSPEPDALATGVQVVPRTEATDVSPPVTVPAVTLGTLRFSFVKSSWVRVSDRDGKNLLNKTIPAGGTEVVEGAPPMKLEIGNAAGVQLNYNQKPIDLGPHTQGNVARFTLE